MWFSMWLNWRLNSTWEKPSPFIIIDLTFDDHNFFFLFIFSGSVISVKTAGRWLDAQSGWDPVCGLGCTSTSLWEMWIKFLKKKKLMFFFFKYHLWLTPISFYTIVVRWLGDQGWTSSLRGRSSTEGLCAAEQRSLLSLQRHRHKFFHEIIHTNPTVTMLKRR